MVTDWLLPLLVVLSSCRAHVLAPIQITISHRKPIVATSTCGEVNGQPIKEVFCSLAGSNQYSPYSQYSYKDDQKSDNDIIQEMRNPREAMFLGGHGCAHCEAGTRDAHPATAMVDGNTSWWQSPPLSRGMQYNEVNITIDLEQEFHVAYVFVHMANSPKPSTWVLERSSDLGKTFKPWYYFAVNPAECMRRFGEDSLSPIVNDEDVICRSDLSSIQPLENAEILINLLEHRPSKNNFTASEALQNFTRATNVRLRLLGTRTLQGHLMDLNEKRDPTVTRRYFYGIKEISIGGRCVCNGHAATCDILDANRPRALLCRCEHNTCGDMCETCCPGFVQKKWQPTTPHNNFSCEPCNCFGRSNECVYEEELDILKKSLDIHGVYKGGGRCINCRDYTTGINCNECVTGFYRPNGVQWSDTMPCKPCNCDPSKHTGSCSEGDGKCECQPRFEGENCDRCAKGYYDPPECKKCECAVDGTYNETCLPIDGQCPCKQGFGGTFCETCDSGFTNFTAGCLGCVCNDVGSEHSNCSTETGQCVCKSAFSGLSCDKCQLGYYGFPNCTYCNCDPVGTEGGQCDQSTGQCLCKEGYVGDRCDKCDVGYYGYPNCQSCTCDGAGSSSPICDASSGQCPCYGNFTSRTCDKCAAGYYDYPNCKTCSCLIEGAKGQSCDNDGNCYCKGNFEGERCDRCKSNFYNFPACEECNCNPAGVTLDFAGCDKVAPGELCSCRENVVGRICDQCKPKFWDLQYTHEEGCVQCGCHPNGTLSDIQICDIKSGQCLCKRNAGGRTCDRCAEGFYNLQGFNQLGCETCDCDIGGAVRGDCDIITGQCRCRPRITGRKCDKPIENHYFPTLWHNQYEAEEGHTEDNKPVRFAVDGVEFKNFSWRGYAVFSPIQEVLILEVDITKSSVYRLLLKYKNPTPVQITADVTLSPRALSSHDQEQKEKVTFAPSNDPQIKEVTVKGKPFVMNPGRWALKIATKQRLYLDYVVVLPAEYYTGAIMKERAHPACHSDSIPNSTCVNLMYPPIPSSARADVSAQKNTFKYVNYDGSTTDIELEPIEILPEIIGPAAYIQAGEDPKVIEARINIEEGDDYVIVVEYHNGDKTSFPVVLDIAQDGLTRFNGSVKIQHCPFTTFCREVVTDDGIIQTSYLEEGEAIIQIRVDAMNQFGLAAVNLIRKSDWNIDYLQQVPVCVRKNGKCVPQEYPPAANSIVAEASAGPNQEKSVSGEKLPFPIANPKEVRVVPLDETRATFDISGFVPTKGHYMFLIHYYNPDNAPLVLRGLVNYPDRFNEGNVSLAYCPSFSGCLAIFYDKERPEIKQFVVEDKYSMTLYYNSSQKGPIYIKSVTPVPYQSFSEMLLTPLPIDVSAEFVQNCRENFFENSPSTVSDFCRDKIFSLTADFNSAAFSCDCNAKGSESFCCDEYGGQCKCKANIIGRRCDRCAPGYYGYPECIKCKCGEGQLCDEHTGQCYCPPHVEGETCGSCVGNAFGYDRLIGCELCGCHPQGSESGSLQCDSLNGQCLCRESVGGRVCDRCLAGFYAFPQCYECRCNKAGTTQEICDPKTATCQCKDNVYGPGCDTCKAGTFHLTSDNPLGCIDCFCFGITGQCRSSMFPVVFENIDLAGFITTDLTGQVSTSDDVITYTSSETSESTYFIVPIINGNDYTTSFGLMLSAKLSVTPRNPNNRAISTTADIRLYGNNITAEFWQEEQPSNPEQTFAVRARLVPENFMYNGERPITREELMMLLNDLQNITIKASYFEETASATLLEFALEKSVNDHTVDSVVRASSVEQCNCPAPYTGPSCQQCATGYYRVEGNYLGACVPCDCNGHSGSCDSLTGKCFDCEDNTHGDHCELCNEGHYGDATTGSPYACMPCQCPYAPDNNFATTCQVSEYGELLSCNCKPGYTGERCDRCSAGYFGEPNRPGGSCQPCNCNGNNNLTDFGSCHPVSGDCFNCEKHTVGRRCEWCEPWFYGDAVSDKNCASCSCDQCGSNRCDNQSGNCTCKPNVEGENCNRCAPDHFGFSKCRGCEPCHCGQASSSTQCHADSGQCACRPGAAGLRCEHCEHGFWNYDVHGCQKCDCEADLSMGTVCDVRTGQCHCQEGATGPRCDQCEKSYLRIPTMGCRRCDECVHHLIADTDLLSIQFGLLNTSIGNISSATVVGARLSRSKKALTNLVELSQILTNSDNEYNNFIGDARIVLTSESNLFINANRSFAVSSDYSHRVRNVSEDAEDILQDIRDRIDYSKTVINSIHTLAEAIGSQSSALNIDPHWIKDAEQILKDLEVAGAVSPPDVVKNIPEYMLKLKANLERFKEKMTMMRKKVEATKAKSDEISNYLSETQKLLKDSKKKSDATIKAAQQQSLFTLEGLASAINNDVEKLMETRRDVSTLILDINNKTETMRDAFEGITNSLNILVDIRAEVQEAVETRGLKRAKREPMDISPMKEKVSEIAAEASNLESIFVSARQESKAAIEAATAYQNLTDSLASAQSNSQDAIELIDERQENIEGVQSEVSKVHTKSLSLSKEADDLQREVLNELQRKADATDRDIERLTQQLDGMRQLRNSVHSSLSSPLKDDMMADIEDRVNQVQSYKNNLNEALESARKEISETKVQADTVIAKQTDAVQAIKQARNNIKELKDLSETLRKSFDKMSDARNQKSNNVEVAQEKLNHVKEIIAVARDAANRVRLGAHFESGSSLDLNLPIRVSQSAAHTDISFYFRTQYPNGIPFFFGNEEGSAGTRAVPTDDYIAVEIEQGTPKVTIDLGDEPLVIKLETRVVDNLWRKIEVERIGKSATVTLSKPNGEDVAETKKASSTGNKSVLNLHQTQSRLFVGGIPAKSQIDRSVRNRLFYGDIEELLLHGEPVGLWNARNGGMVNVNGAPRRYRSDGSSSNTGVSLNGEGYIVHDLGHWNPRKKTVLSLQFLTYSPEGLLFYIGKDSDFMSIELSLGSIKLSVDFGSGVGQWTTDSSEYNNGKWHTVSINRDGVHLKLEVDGKTVAEGDAPGEQFEMSVTDKFYLGGIPSGVSTRSPVVPLRGCLRAVRLGSDELDLLGRGVSASKGLRSTCPLGSVRTVSILSERSSAVFENMPSREEAEVTLRFKTREQKGLLLNVRSEEDDHLLQLEIDNGQLMVSAGEDKLTVEVASASDEQWHFVSVRKGKSILRVDVDDIYSQHIDRHQTVEENGETASIVFGKQADGSSFVGCVGDVTYNGELLDFAKAKIHEVSLTGCSLKDDEIKTTVATITTSTTPVPSSDDDAALQLRPDGHCALPIVPRGINSDSDGLRFGGVPGSRVEYEVTNESFDKTGTFTLDLLATANSGVILFASNEKQSDHIGLFLENGRVVFTYNSGNGANVVLKSKKSVMDGKWHSIKASRTSTESHLVVDDESVEIEISSVESIETKAPLFVGGVPSELSAYTRTIIAGVRSEFGGCIRGFKLNKKMLENKHEYGVQQCSSFTEDGMFFGEKGGYAILKKEYHVGQTFIADIEVRPRTQDAVLFSVGKVEYLSVQINNGSVKFTIDSGAGAESLVYSPSSGSSLCDGHWHSIKIMKKKNLMTLTVDGKSNLHIMKKSKKPETVTNDPIYLGGLPDGAEAKGLDTKAPYIGCLRITNYGDKKTRVIRRRKQIDVSKLEVFGDVSNKGCPVN
ncbi:unnamed protein product [Auanema sp. JU1783]|nr:unnamed protein product [Auanema sp. JU1783]